MIVDLRSELPQASVPDGWKRVAADVRREEEIAAAVVATLDGLGRLDIVVANAGVVPPWRETEALDLAEWDDVFAINCPLPESEQLHTRVPQALRQRPLGIPCQGVARLVRRRHGDRRRD